MAGYVMILLKNEVEIEKIRTASRYAMEILLYLKERIKEGVTGLDLERMTEERLKSLKNVTPAFKGYNGYPYCLCVSINEEIVHGMPEKRVIKEGDIVSLDFGAIYDGFYGDAALTIGVGEISDTAKRLISVTEKSLYMGINEARVGKRLYDISSAVQSCVEDAGFSVVRDFVGHGIGRSLHEEPQIPNFGKKGTGIRLKKGMVMAIEPMVNAGGSEVMIKENGWTAVSKDGSLSAHFEHTIAITENGPDILSRV
ncbi:MAG: type I methionyl aminopeptidase [Syntrophorhabdaceae bacterium]|nr:type I methionyl aminopeptidase [Syntrophorhabdaceae bacterium]